MRVGVIAFEKKTAGHGRTEVAEGVLQRIVKLDYALWASFAVGALINVLSVRISTVLARLGC